MPRATTKGPAALAKAPQGTVTQIACRSCGPAHLLHVEVSDTRPKSRVLFCRRCRRTEPLPAQMEVARAGGAPLPGLEDTDMSNLTTTPRGGSARNDAREGRIQRLMARAVADVEPAPGIATSSSMSGGEAMVPVADIAPHALNPRKAFDQEALDELAASIRADGLLQPIVVRSAGAVPPGVPRWWIVAGERRWRAAQIAGLEEVPVRVVQVADDAHHLRLALLENLARRDLDPVEEARGYELLRTLGGMSQADIASSIGRAPSSVANAVRLLGLPGDVLRRISAGELTASHGKALLRYAAFPDVASKLGALAAERGTTSKELEAGLQHARDLAQAKLIAELPSSYSAPFDIEICRKCPFGARVKDAVGFHYWCLKPPHLRQLKREAKAAKEAALAAATNPEASEAGDGAGLIQLDGLRYGEVVDLKHQDARRPAECRKGMCECLRFGRRGSSTEAIPVCIKPSRFSALQDEELKQREAALRERMAVAQQAADTVVAATPADDARALALLVAAVLTTGRYDDEWHIVEAVTRWAPGVHLPKGQPDWWGGKTDLPSQLAALPAESLVRLALDVVLRMRIWRRFAVYANDDGWLRWFLPEADALREGPAPDATAAAYPRVHAAPCGRCGGVVTINSADEEAGLAADLAAGAADGKHVEILCDNCPPEPCDACDDDPSGEGAP